VPRLGSQALRVGVPGDFAALLLPAVLAKFRARHPDIRFIVRSQHFDLMSRDLRQGELELMIGLSESGIGLDARHQWMEPMVWVRQPGFELDPGAPVPIVTFGEACALHRAGVAALNQAQRPFEIVFSGPSEACILAAVKGGLGVSMLARSRANVAGIDIWEEAPLPQLGDLSCGIYLGETGDRLVLEQLADAIFEVLGPKDTNVRLFASAAVTGAIGQY
jgi:DNA-binding transcriptional LysR family regulator